MSPFSSSFSSSISAAFSDVNNDETRFESPLLGEIDEDRGSIAMNFPVTLKIFVLIYNIKGYIYCGIEGESQHMRLDSHCISSNYKKKLFAF